MPFSSIVRLDRQTQGYIEHGKFPRCHNTYLSVVRKAFGIESPLSKKSLLELIWSYFIRSLINFFCIEGCNQIGAGNNYPPTTCFKRPQKKQERIYILWCNLSPSDICRGAILSNITVIYINVDTRIGMFSLCDSFIPQNSTEIVVKVELAKEGYKERTGSSLDSQLGKSLCLVMVAAIYSFQTV